MRRFLHVVIVAALSAAPLVALAAPADFMMQAVVAGRLLEGQPLAWSKERIQLLGRDGALYDFAVTEAQNAKRLGGAYQGYSSADMKAILQGELGASFDVTTTPHFVVAHPHGQWQAWGARLEAIYRNFTVYMSVRWAKLQQPATPLAAIVFRNERDYFKYAAAGGTQLAPGTLGHYDPATNRIYLFDVSDGSGDADWQLNASTIIHEATHQAAYNTGIHARFAEQPRWLVEGLAMLFESPGVWNPGPTTSRASRINAERLAYFRAGTQGRGESWIPRLIASDNRFVSDALAGYAEAWTLTFYLSETRPQQYGAYLAQVAKRSLFATYSAQDRVRDFVQQFGADVPQLEAQVQEFVDELP